MTSVPILREILDISLTAAPWLLAGLLAAGLIKALVPDVMLQRWVGGRGLAAVSRAAIIGAPLPLCSCGAIPTALALYRGGAGRGPTTAFLIGTPGVGADSVALTYALLGPVMLLARIAGAVATAVSTGLLVAGSDKGDAPARAVQEADACCRSCATGDRSASLKPPTAPLAMRLRGGMSYAFGELLDDIGSWILLGLAAAGALSWAVPPQTLATYGSGLLPMLVMSVVGIPMYICAAAATPIAAAMVLAGVSPGTALVFLLAGPITSLATLGLLRREMGTQALARYLSGIMVTTVAAGLVLDLAVGWLGLDVIGQFGAARELLPRWLEAMALALLVVLAVRPLRRILSAPVSTRSG